MRLCLVFTPFSSFSYLPLGIAYLKSFLGKNAPFVRVKNLDLSNNFYHNLGKEEFLEELLALCRICPQDNKSGCQALLKGGRLTNWAKAISIVKACLTDPKSDAFSDVRKYNELINLYNIFYRQIYQCFNNTLKYSLQQGSREDNLVLERLFEGDLCKISSERPDIVGFSLFSETQLFYALALAKMIKTNLNVPIIFGGAQIAHLDKKTFLRMFDFIDFLIYKEGEIAISALLNSLAEKNFVRVPNLVYRKKGRTIENKESMIDDLNQVPFPDFSDYNLKGYFTPQPVLSTIFTRGCFWRACTFCAHHKTYSQLYRARSVANLILELKSYQKKGIKHICLADELIPARNLDALSKALLKEKVAIYYTVMLKPTGDFTLEILQKMYQSGCRIIRWGVESFSQRILDLMNKGTHAETIIKVLKASSAAGIANAVCMIRGFPTQTAEEILKDEALIEKNSEYIFYSAVHDFRLEVDTTIFQNPKKFGLRYLRRNLLLKTKGYKLLSPRVFFVCKNSAERQKPLRAELQKMESKRINSELWKGGIFYTLEHALFYLSSKKQLPGKRRLITDKVKIKRGQN